MSASIWERVETALAEVGYPSAASLYLGTLPDTYLVYSLVSSPAEQHADNVETQRSYRVQVLLFARGAITSVMISTVSSAMMAAGFVPGPMRQMPFSQVTKHFGLVLEFVTI